MDLTPSRLLQLARQRYIVRWPVITASRRSIPGIYEAQPWRHCLSTIATVPECPKPDCQCAEMPEGLDIDYKSKLDGTVASYDCHVVIRTGRNDWPSRIEEDEHLPHVKSLKNMLGRHGEYHNPFRNVLISTSSHPDNSKLDEPNFLFFPSFKSAILHGDASKGRANSEKGCSNETSSLENLIRQHMLPEALSSREMDSLPLSQQSNLVRSPLSETQSAQITGLKILICGHGKRDERCGILGPILKTEFERQLELFEGKLPSAGSHVHGAGPTVELISHIGGHKFAGNVILYFPREGEWVHHPLTGMGVWMGRVRPEHVQGIMQKTVLEGTVIKDLFRGGIDGNGEMLRLDGDKISSK